MSIYLAKRIPVLRFSRIPDTSGSIIPPEAFCKHPKSLTITYSKNDREFKAGKANLYREGNVLYADMLIRSKMKDTKKAVALMKLLYPAVSFHVHDSHNKTILSLTVTEIFLTTSVNDDLNIENLGNRIIQIPTKEQLH